MLAGDAAVRGCSEQGSPAKAPEVEQRRNQTEFTDESEAFPDVAVIAAAISTASG